MVIIFTKPHINMEIRLGLGWGAFFVGRYYTDI